MMNYYRASWDPNMLPAIRGMGLSLRTHEPLEKQNPGPLWHPFWINRYYDLTRDPEYVPFILKYARMLVIENSLHLTHNFFRPDFPPVAQPAGLS